MELKFGQTRVVRSMTLRDVWYLRGEDLEVCRGDIFVEGGRVRVCCGSFQAPGGEWEWEGGVVFPGFSNSHLHVFDAGLKESWMGRSLSELFGVGGQKSRFLSSLSEAELEVSARESLEVLLRTGTTLAVIFVEEGLRGLRVLRRVLEDFPLRVLLLGRPLARPVEEGEVFELLEFADGLGLSTAGEFSSEELSRMARCCGDKIRAVHMAEFRPTENFWRVVKDFRADVVVHGNYLSGDQIGELAGRGVGLVACLRSGCGFGVGVLDVGEVYRRGLLMGYGTDNVMCNMPDMFREVEYVARWQLQRGVEGFSPELVLRGATVNGGRLYSLPFWGPIEEGYWANFVLLRSVSSLFPFRGAASIIFRGSSRYIRYIVVGDRVISLEDEKI